MRRLFRKELRVLLLAEKSAQRAPCKASGYNPTGGGVLFGGQVGRDLWVQQLAAPCTKK